MLRKLIGYDFMSTWKLNTLVLGLSMAAAAVGAVALAYEDKVTVLGTVAIFSILFAIMAPLSIIILVAIHYHKKFFSDEAYLTFTLPATPGQHLASKMISGSIWNLISGLVVFVNVIAIVMITVILEMPAVDEGVGEEIVEPLIIESWMVTGILGWIVYMFVGVIAELALLYLSLTISGNIATKHKGLVGVGIYMLVNSVASTVMSIVEVPVLIGMFAMSTENIFAVLPYIMCVLYLGLGAACLWLNHYFLSRKLNLQ